MRIAGGVEDLALSGWDGAGDDGPLFVLGEGARVGAQEGDVRLALRGDGGSGRVVAPAGDGLWRRAPWPARDALLDLELPAVAGRVLVVGAPAEVAEQLRAAEADVDERERLTVDGLRAADVVVLFGGHGALPAHALCVLAARRVLVTDATDVAFGLQNGIEFLLARSADEAVERARMAVRYPDAVAALRVMGARAARDHRASVVYPRLAADLPPTTPPRSSAPRG